MNPEDWRTAIEAIQRRKEWENEQARQRHEIARLKARERVERGQASPIDAMNAEYRLEDVLLQYGYQKYGNRWLSPLSESGHPGVTLSDDGRKWISAHGSDVDAGLGIPCNNGCMGDAFDLYCHFEHGGDSSAALRGAAELLGLDRVSPSEFPDLSGTDNRPPTGGREEPLEPCADGGPAEPWETPVDLFQKVIVPPLERHMVPGVIWDWAEPNAKLLGIDTGTMAMMALTACAGAITDGIRIQPKASDPEWTEAARLWFGTVNPPSFKKTPALNKALRLLWAEQRRANEEWAAKAAAWEQQAARAKKAGAPPPPKPLHKRVIADDFTIEKLTEILTDNPEGILVVNDELADFFAGIYRYQGGRGAGEAGKWLRLRDGGPTMIDRIGRGSYLVPNWGASVIGGIQPSTLKKAMDNMPHDGLLQRFLLTMGQSVGGQSEVPVPQPVRTAYARLVDRLVTRPARELKALITLSPEADLVRQDVFRRHDALQLALDAHPALSSAIGKFNGFYANLLLTIHCIYLAGEGYLQDELQQEQPVPVETAKQVAELMRWLLQQTVAFYQSVMDIDGVTDVRGSMYDDAQKVAEVILREGWQEVTTSAVSQHVHRWRHRNDKERDEVLNTLEVMRWLRRVPVPIGLRGRPMKGRFLVNPQVHALFSEKAAAARTAAEEIAKLAKRGGE